MNNSALLIIDMQNDFIKNHTGPVYIPKSEKIIVPIISLINKFNSEKLHIINIVTEHYVDKKLWAKKDIELDRAYCIENTQGAEVIDELKMFNMITVKKRLYSGFFETDLLNILKSLKINDLYFAGVTTGCCVSATARDAYNYNFNLFFVKDCLASSSINSHQLELQFFNKSLGKVVDLSLVLHDKSV